MKTTYVQYSQKRYLKKLRPRRKNIASYPIHQKMNVKNAIRAAAYYHATLYSSCATAAAKMVFPLIVKSVKESAAYKEEDNQNMIEEVKNRKCLRCK